MIVSSGRHGRDVYTRYILPVVPLAVLPATLLFAKPAKRARQIILAHAAWSVLLWVCAVLGLWGTFDFRAPWNRQRARICCARAPSVLHAECALSDGSDHDYVLSGFSDCTAWERVSIGLLAGGLMSAVAAAYDTWQLSGYILAVLVTIPGRPQHRHTRPRLIGLLFGLYSIAIAVMLAGAASDEWHGGHRGAAVLGGLTAVFCLVHHQLVYVYVCIALFVQAVVFLGPLQMACSDPTTRARLKLTDTDCNAHGIEAHIAVLVVITATLWAADIFVGLRQALLHRSRAAQ